MSSERIGWVCVAVVVATLAGACGGSSGGTSGTGGAGGAGGTGGTGGDPCAGLPVKAQSCMSTAFSEKINNKIDILFMIDNSSAMTEMQQKLSDQFPNFVSTLQSAQIPPDLHIAVVSSDMGAPGDATSGLGCTTGGDQGQFEYLPRGTCTDTTLQSGATFISNADLTPNYTDPSLSQVLQCIGLLGPNGCGFEHQLASIDRALGADGSPAPTTNAGFLRPDAYLGIVILTNEDDCSAPSNTQLFSLNVGGSNQQNIANALGPLGNYRCNEFGHLCTDPGGNQIMPPLNPPNGATTLDLTNCVSNDTNSGLLTPVSKFVSDIRALKPDPDNQILVAAITGPSSPYAVKWAPEIGGQNTQPGELWPEVMHSCGPYGGDDLNPEATMNPTDGSFADPSVRITQFVSSFQDSVVRSVCDASYASSMSAIATKLGQLITPPCVTQTIQNDSNGDPDCLVVESVENDNVIQRTTIPYCPRNGNVAPCWSMRGGSVSCTGETLLVNDTAQNAAAQDVTVTLSCSVCQPGLSGQQGCPFCVPTSTQPCP